MSGKIIPVILSGGSGKRLWPLSRENYPKQFLALHSEKPLLIEAAERVQGPLFEKPIIIAHEAHRFIIAELMEAARLEYEVLIIEPEAKNTAAPIYIAALHARKIHGPEAVLLVVTSDHVIKDQNLFQDTIQRAADVAADSKLLCVGMKPEYAETGYGYIKQGTAIDKKKNIYKVENFTEKPDLKKAQAYLKEGGYYWNSGMYMARADLFIREMNAHAADIAGQAEHAYEKADKDLHFLRLDREEFSKVRAQSIDKAVTEVTKMRPSWWGSSIGLIWEATPSCGRKSRKTKAEMPSWVKLF